MSNSKENFKSGKVVLIGEPNVGKSSIVNAIVGEDVSIVTNIAGTTREEIRGIKTTDKYQIIFLDTPGMHKAHNQLQKFMSRSISHALSGADLIVYVIDSTDFKDAYIKKLSNYENAGIPVIVVINKTDKTTFEKMYPRLDALGKLSFVKSIIPTSVKNGFNIDVLEGEIAKYLPYGIAMHDEENYTTQTTKKMSEEIIRKSLLELTKREIPHSVAVKITKFDEGKKEIEIHADIFCDRESQKPIIIGKRGELLKRVGETARKEIQALTGKHIKIFTHVIVREGWRDKKSILDDLGYMG